MLITDSNSVKEMHKLLLSSLVLVACLMAATVHSKVRAVPAKRVLAPQLTKVSASSGFVAIERGRSALNGNCYVRLFVDGEAAADIDSEEYIHLYLAPGLRLLSTKVVGVASCASAAVVSERVVDVVRGGGVNLHLVVDFDGSWPLLVSPAVP